MHCSSKALKKTKINFSLFPLKYSLFLSLPLSFLSSFPLTQSLSPLSSSPLTEKHSEIGERGEIDVERSAWWVDGLRSTMAWWVGFAWSAMAWSVLASGSVDCGLGVGGGGLLIRGLLWCVGVIVVGVVWLDCGCGSVGFVVIVVACFVSEKRETKRKREKEIEMVMNKKKNTI